MVQTRRKFGATVMAIGVSLAVLLPTSAVTANAATEDKTSSAETQYNGIYVVSEAAVAPDVEGKATFIPLPENAKQSLVVLPEVARKLNLKQGKVAKADEARVFGELGAPGGKKKSEPTVTPMATTSNWTNFNAPLGGGWSGSIRRNTSFIGSGGKVYNWYMDGATGTSVCAQGVGYYQGYYGSSFGIWRTWYDIGCGRAATIRVPWDGVSAYPEFNVRSITYTWGFGQFE
ncbi:hypothetical protein [Arthrobacter humicola]|uniref:hypothetical protein n=1 Tax=Arthrobacter humicola TaxID=409291 RepID=UPI001FADB067|nr:hypothetical protein [Arthrobacter humicola]MCI9872816.1 hypothetical protein [Arthrobacter humicola]